MYLGIKRDGAALFCFNIVLSPTNKVCSIIEQKMNRIGVKKSPLVLRGEANLVVKKFFRKMNIFRSNRSYSVNIIVYSNWEFEDCLSTKIKIVFCFLNILILTV